MDLEDDAVANLANKDLARWFADPASKEYWFHVRIVGSIIELHAEHLATDQRYVARARRMEEAAPQLLRMIAAYAAVPACRGPDERASVVSRAWKQAAKAVTRVYYAVAG